MDNNNIKKASNVFLSVGRAIASVCGTILKVLGAVILIALTSALIFACIAAINIKAYVEPQLDMNLSDFTLDLSSTIYYKDNETGEWLELKQIHGLENRIWLDYEEIPRYFELGTIAIEDKRFYDHQGVDWYRTGGAFINMFLGMRDNFGGSTITQQLIKNLTDEDDVTVSRKILEIFRALDFEKNNSKETIIEWYLNTIYLGQGCNGIATASQVYFAKDVSELTLAECASIVGITNNPSMFDPYIDKEANKSRQRLILKEMYTQGMINRDEYYEAIMQPLEFKRGKTSSADVSVNSYYVDQIIYDVVDDLMTEYNISEVAAYRLLATAGYQIYACIDMDIQNMVDEVYGDLENLPYISSSGQQLQSAMTIIDPYTGRVMAMAGGMGEKTGSLDWNRATMTKRQPGSSIKPLSVYAPAINLGLITPKTIMEDTPLSYENGVAYPRNASWTYRGPVTIMEAVRISLNTIPVKLVNQMTPQVSFNFMENNLGFDLVDRREQDGRVYTDIALSPLAMGGLTDGVSTMEMAAAYACFPNGGIYYAPMTYYRIEDSEGGVIFDNESSGNTAMKEVTAHYLNVLLRNVVTSGTGTAAALSGMPVGGKTGTTDDNYDRWFAGYTPYYAGIVWTGYDNPETINISANPAIPIWKAVMSRIHEGLEYKDFFTTATSSEILNNLTDITTTDPPEESKPPEESEPPEESVPPEESTPPVTSESPITSEPPVTSEPPGTSEPPVTSEPPGTSEPPATSDAPVTDGIAAA